MNKPFYYTVMAILIGVSVYFISNNWKSSRVNIEKAKTNQPKKGEKPVRPMMQKAPKFTAEQLTPFMDKLGDFTKEEKANIVSYFFDKSKGLDTETMKIQAEKSLQDGKALNHAILKSAYLGTQNEYGLAGQLMIESASIIPKEEDKKVFLNLANIQFKKEIEKNPNNLKVRNYLASSLLDVSDANIFESLALLRGTLAKDKNNYKAHFILGSLSIKSNQLKKAVIRFKKCISLQPQNSEPYMQLSRVYMLMKSRIAKDSAVYFRNEGIKILKQKKK